MEVAGHRLPEPGWLWRVRWLAAVRGDLWAVRRLQSGITDVDERRLVCGMGAELRDAWRQMVAGATLAQDVATLGRLPCVDAELAAAVAHRLRGAGWALAARVGGLGTGLDAVHRVRAAFSALVDWLRLSGEGIAAPLQDQDPAAEPGDVPQRAAIDGRCRGHAPDGDPRSLADIAAGAAAPAHGGEGAHARHPAGGAVWTVFAHGGDQGAAMRGLRLSLRAWPAGNADSVVGLEPAIASEGPGGYALLRGAASLPEVWALVRRCGCRLLSVGQEGGVWPRSSGPARGRLRAGRAAGAEP